MIDLETVFSAWTGHRQFAEWLVTVMKPEVIVDLGVDYGYSTFCLANPGIGTVYGIDSFEGDVHTGFHADTFDKVHNMIKENNYTNVEIIKGYFDEVCETWDKKIDILHIDGLHTYEATLNNYEKWKRHLTDKSVLIMHDTVSFPEVRQVYDEIDMPKLMFEHSAGLGVLSNNAELMNLIKEKYGAKD